MLSDRCLSCLSVCDVGVLWPNGWTDQDETWRAGRPRPWPHCVRWGPSSPPSSTQPPIFGRCLLWPNGWTDQDATRYEGRPRPRRLSVRWGRSSPSPKRKRSLRFSAHVYCGQTAGWIKMALGMGVGLGSGTPGHILLDGDPAPQFLAHYILLWRNGCIYQDTTWYGGRPQPEPRQHCVRWGFSSQSHKGAQPPPKFRSVSVVAKRLDGSRTQDVTWFGGKPQPRRPDVVLVGSQLPLKGAAHVYCGQTAGWMKTRLSTEVDLGPGHTVLDGTLLPAKGAQQPPDSKGN